MKPFALLLLLIASGILFATLTRPLTLLAEAASKLGRLPDRLKAKRQTVSLNFPTVGRSRTRRKPALRGDRWRPATQF